MPLPSTARLIARLRKEFPFPRYFYLGTEAQADTLREVRNLLPHGGSVLDIGCGPLDKTVPLAWAGYACSAIDDFADPWHRHGNNLNKIKAFAKSAGVALTVGDGRSLPYPPQSFDLVMLNDVIEHMASSPRELLNAAAGLLKPQGYLLVTVPNAVNIRKRLDVLRGKTNLPPYAMYYWYEGPWRGHIREYARDDLVQLARYLGMGVVKLTGCHHMLGVLPRPLRPLYKATTALFPGWRDSWILILRKPPRWQPRAKARDAKAFGLDFTQDFTL